MLYLTYWFDREQRARATGYFLLGVCLANILSGPLGGALLEMDGVLKSWAVPKGPSIDPGQNRLAMRTEDHPLDYADFEGTIPKGEYGGGTVMLWDRGRWIPHPDKDPRKTIEEGHLHFTLEGERMKGEWLLIRLKPRAKEKRENWLPRKIDDAAAGGTDTLVDEALTSISTGRTMAEIAEGKKPARASKAAPPPSSRRKPGPRAKSVAADTPDPGLRQNDGTLPEFRDPQLCTLVDAVPTGAQVKDVLATTDIRVNGEPEDRRGRQLRSGDVVSVEGFGDVRIT